MKIISKLILCCLLAPLWAACSDVEGEGKPQPLKLRMESTDYYVQITSENVDGIAFVLRWTNADADKYAIALAANGVEQTIGIADHNILTYNDVREQQITNKELMEALHTFGLFAPNAEPVLTLTLTATGGEVGEEIKTAIIHFTLAPDIS